MSICQGGIGIPFLAPPVYEYLCSEQCTGLSVKVADLPDPTLKFVIEKVYRNLLVILWHMLAYFMHQCQQIDNAENDDEFKVIFGIDEAADMLLSTGFRKPISQLCLSDRTCVRSVLLDYHCMLKVSFMPTKSQGFLPAFLFSSLPPFLPFFFPSFFYPSLSIPPSLPTSFPPSPSLPPLKA